jgi:hypothetical protein
MGVLFTAACLSCKRGEEKSDEPNVVELPVPVVPTTDQAAAREPKRYGDQEKSQVGSVRVGSEGAKVLVEASDTGEQVAVLTKGTLVARKASYGSYVLVDYPSEAGGMKSGWVAEKDLGTASAATAQPTAKQDGGTKSTEDKGTDKTSNEDKSADKGKSGDKEETTGTGGVAAKAGSEESGDDKADGEKDSSSKKKVRTPTTRLPKRVR